MDADSTPVVALRSDRLRGTRSRGVAAFKRIPYAADPFTPQRRFQAPQPAAPWQGIRDAGALGPPPPQPGRDPKASMHGGTGDLTVNVWTPDPHASGLPVMVWIPGGAFIRADAGEAACDGTRFAHSGIVLVTVNYRVGVDGFMAIEGAPANRGLLDQIAALQWVRDNIAAFGGDAANVTLFGQSAGAESIAILLASPRADGLFHRAILQSPPMQSMQHGDARRLAAVFARGLGAAPTAGSLAAVPMGELIGASPALAGVLQDRAAWGRLSLGGTAFLPVIDGDLLDAPPLDMLARGLRPRVPVVVGSTDEEARIYMVPGGAIHRITPADVDRFVGDLELPPGTLEIYRPVSRDPSPGEVYTALQSDYTFRKPALRIAETRSRSGMAWHYHFSWKSPGFGGQLGAAHFVDVPFAFGTQHSGQARPLLGDDPPDALADAMHSAWVAFARTGDPGWPAYDLARRATKRFDAPCSVVLDPERTTRGLWNGVAF
ncbi:carboxylesterase family protein [Acidovorax sp. NCPPB 3859]|nr:MULTISPECIES: carboxylesterase family protein [unclassified Acidovorax]MDA8449468.1 carboxylesterase family protein [Acidovorax sp. GBBC 3297]MDA8458443.1 carboxylesterase family protein [Acidovorax sp. GBBC 3333]MDA8463481.1 carboxylesterase family protein [Acidovorax sp. GBBC 3332]MDA8468648.1 carboxylesterase family protein [Acidovorax sp. GBBC 3299]WCM77004.1 carboxylesterase family protein [Acidovorax sp. GBBC 712]